MGEEVNAAWKWMLGRGWKPQVFQETAWAALAKGGEGIVNAPTGSGKTYSLMLPFLAKFSGQTKPPDGIRLIWITPIRALSKEIHLSAQRVIQEMKLSVKVIINQLLIMILRRMRKLLLYAMPEKN